MSLDGLRAWIGEVERKLDMRTKVMLALAAIAIGGAAVGIYLAIDTRENAVSEKDVQELQTQLEERIATGGDGTEVAALEAELNALQVQVAELEARGKGSPGGSGSGNGKAGGSESPGGVAPESLPEPGTGVPEEK